MNTLLAHRAASALRVLLVLSALFAFGMSLSVSASFQVNERVPRRNNQKIVDALTASLEIERDAMAAYNASLATSLAPADMRQKLTEILIEHEKHEKATLDYLEREGALGDAIVIAKKNYSRMTSARELLERMMREEDRCIELHKKTRKQLKGPVAREDFDLMIRQERQHIEILKKLLDSEPKD